MKLSFDKYDLETEYKDDLKLITMCKTGNQSWVQDQVQDWRILRDRDRNQDWQPFT